MKVLIDTHIAIWAVLNNPKLPKQARDIIIDKEKHDSLIPYYNETFIISV